ncbi:uncharacterized protein LOC107370612 isoform X2 [Tetranychus urticae]|uniref:uncharacterized protein LOC107370612 isoform X2 n=1 Tax=Tetranychus urticae TaxID=32264 RepID=UPI00077BEE27|nr:uncharacterized protein LOC107370612 isoform X2 [Tetranychus urticae]
MMITPLKSDLIDEKVSSKYKRLRTEAVCEPAIIEGFSFKEKPSWYDENKFKRAQNWAYHHFVRYESDPFKEGSEANKSLRKINTLHCNIVKSMNGLVPKESSEPIWVTQYDMALILWSIMAPIVLFPRKCGIHEITRSQMEDLIHFWAVLAYTLGIKDENNIMLSDYDETFAICDMILAKDVRPVSKERKYPSDHGFEVSKVLAVAIQPLAPIVSLQGLMRQWYRIFGITASVPVEHKFGYKSMVTLADTLLKYTVFRWMFAALLKFMLILRTWQRAKITATMNTLYPDEVHPDVDPHSFTPKELLAY